MSRCGKRHRGNVHADRTVTVAIRHGVDHDGHPVFCKRHTLPVVPLRVINSVHGQSIGLADRIASSSSGR